MINQNQQNCFNYPRDKRLQGNILMGFWHNWSGNDSPGYQGGRPATIDLTEVHHNYNIVVVSFMKVIEGSHDPIPNFIPFKYTDEEFTSQIISLQQQGKIVLISLGGADAHIELHKGQEKAFYQRIIELSDKYGFDGLDIDLEQAAINAADNNYVIPTALKLVKDYYRAKGENFIISMAPEFPYLTTLSGKYEPYIKGLEGYYDIIAPQFYNQGGDGVWVDGIGWLSQSDNTKKEDFLFFLTDSIVTGTRGFIKIPHDKFVIGLPSNVDAAGSGYVTDPAIVKNVFNRLKNIGIPIRGLMTWSVNWDIGHSKSGHNYQWEFASRYGYLVNHDDNETTIPPSVPANISSSECTATTITINWSPSYGSNPIAFYTVYRNGVILRNTDKTEFTDSGLAPDSDYSYQITAIDTANNTSSLSSPFVARTLGKEEENQSYFWTVDQWYKDDEVVKYASDYYTCNIQHTSNKFWSPDKATSLWTKCAI